MATIGKRAGMGIVLAILSAALLAGVVQLAFADNTTDEKTSPQVVSLTTEDGASVSGVIVLIDGERLFLTESDIFELNSLSGWSEEMLDHATVAYGKMVGAEYGLTGPAVITHKSSDPLRGDNVIFVRDGEAFGASWAATKGLEKPVFDDVAADSWVMLEGWLDKAIDAGIMHGYADAAGADTRRFGPDDFVTRGQLLTMLYRASVNDASDTLDTTKFASNSVSAFSDNLGNRFYTAAVNWAYEQGIVYGDIDEDGASLGTVRPDDPISRQEMATVLCRFADGAGAAGDEAYAGAPDVASVADFAVKGVAWCFTNGVMTGDKLSGKLMPTANATRAHSCKMVMVAFDLVKAKSDSGAVYAALDESGNRI